MRSACLLAGGVRLAAAAWSGHRPATGLPRSEAFWQRCWASASDSTLRLGAILACCYITLAVAFYGILGLLALWANMFDWDADPYGSTILFSILQGNVLPRLPLPTTVLRCSLRRHALCCCAPLHAAWAGTGQPLTPSPPADGRAGVCGAPGDNHVHRRNRQLPGAQRRGPAPAACSCDRLRARPASQRARLPQTLLQRRTPSWTIYLGFICGTPMCCTRASWCWR